MSSLQSANSVIAGPGKWIPGNEGRRPTQGLSSLATSGHLPPGPSKPNKHRRALNTDMPELNYTNYTLHAPLTLQGSVGGGAVWQETDVFVCVGRTFFFFSRCNTLCPVSRSLRCTRSCCVHPPFVWWLEGFGAPLLCWRTVSKTPPRGDDFVSVCGCKPWLDEEMFTCLFVLSD